MRRLVLALAVAFAAPAFAVNTSDADFAATPLPGTTAALEPYLAGSVIYDRNVPFGVSGGAAGVHGHVQVRILRTASGRLDFYYCVFNDATSTGPIMVAQVRNFPKVSYNANWRRDGLGAVAPQSIAGGLNAGVWVLQFQFTGTGVAPGQSSRFFFLSSGYRAWVPDPTTWMRLRGTGNVTVGDLNIPLPRP